MSEHRSRSTTPEARPALAVLPDHEEPSVSRPCRLEQTIAQRPSVLCAGRRSTGTRCCPRRPAAAGGPVHPASVGHAPPAPRYGHLAPVRAIVGRKTSPEERPGCRRCRRRRTRCAAVLVVDPQQEFVLGKRHQVIVAVRSGDQAGRDRGAATTTQRAARTPRLGGHDGGEAAAAEAVAGPQGRCRSFPCFGLRHLTGEVRRDLGHRRPPGAPASASASAASRGPGCDVVVPGAAPAPARRPPRARDGRPRGTRPAWSPRPGARSPRRLQGSRAASAAAARAWSPGRSRRATYTSPWTSKLSTGVWCGFSAVTRSCTKL